MFIWSTQLGYGCCKHHEWPPGVMLACTAPAIAVHDLSMVNCVVFCVADVHSPVRWPDWPAVQVPRQVYSGERCTLQPRVPAVLRGGGGLDSPRLCTSARYTHHAPSPWDPSPPPTCTHCGTEACSFRFFPRDLDARSPSCGMPPTNPSLTLPCLVGRCRGWHGTRRQQPRRVGLNDDPGLRWARGHHGRTWGSNRHRSVLRADQ